jgi:hypothetical protein
MTEPQIAAVFAEFRRIGLDPDSISAPLIVTGFTRRSLIEWLRQIPTGVGAQELDRRLAVHAREALVRADAAGASAEYDPERVDPTPNDGQIRWWPATLVLDAGIQVMAEEWDPIGVKIGSVLPEDLGEYTLQLFGPLLHRSPYGDPFEQPATVIASIECALGLRASPEIHRRFLAARLREILATRPLPVREPRPIGQAASVVIGTNETAPPPLDPEGVCVRCQTFGTVARVTTKSEPPRMLRFCGRCWREVRSVYMSTDTDSPAPEVFGLEPSRSASSRSWNDVVDFVRLVLHARRDPVRGAEITDDLLAQLAGEIATDADTMDGPMPHEIDLFLREFAPSP